MRFLLFSLWPAFIPILIYVAWLAHRRRKAKKAGIELESITKGTLFWTIIASILIAIGCFLYYGLSSQENAGVRYIPPHVENGKLIPGETVPEDAP